jgi:hydroxymethylpyrimidine/phosphomethylpyrimidine kinase
MDCVLIVAGLDPSGGAGLLADVAVVRAHGLHPASVATALTVQDSARCHASEPVDASLVERQLEALTDDMPIKAVKLGMLGSREVARAVARAIAPLARAGVPIVVDPVLRASVGADLLEGDAGEAYADLLAIATLLTPNRDEASVLAGQPVETPEDRRPVLRTLRALGPRAVLLKGGHFDGTSVIDVLDDGAPDLYELKADRKAAHAHGTGCALSTDIACRLAKGVALREAVTKAHEQLQKRIAAAAKVGNGRPFLGAFVAE